jgi:hypothetical protein
VSDAFTKTTALFSGIEVKLADGDMLEAEYQINMFIGASLRKKAEFVRMIGLLDITRTLIEPYLQWWAMNDTSISCTCILMAPFMCLYTASAQSTACQV